jgi:ATP-binding cassette subfamily C (CFTR/MRP) protein 4
MSTNVADSASISPPSCNADAISLTNPPVTSPTFEAPHRRLLPNPLITSSLFSLLFINWAFSLIECGDKVTANDFWELREKESAQYLGAELEKAWELELRASGEAAAAAEQPLVASSLRPASLLRAYWKVFGTASLVAGLLPCIKGAFYLFSCSQLGTLLDALSQPIGVEGADNDAWRAAALLIVSASIAAMLHHHFFFAGWRHGMELRVAGTAILFRKSLRLSLRAVAGENAGKLVNVAATDLDRLTKLTQMGAYLFLAPLEAIAVTTMLWFRLGPSALAGLGALLALTFWQGAFGVFFGRLRARAAAAADERLRNTAAAVTGARVFKANAWEARAAAAVLSARVAELDAVRAAARLRAINEGVFTAASLAACAAVFLVRSLTGGLLRAADVFVCVSLLSFLQVDVCKFFVVAVEGVAEAIVAFKRLEGILRLDEGPQEITTTKQLESSHTVDDEDDPPFNLPPIAVTNLTAAWGPSPSPLVVDGVNLIVRRGEIVCIVGAVGCGKSSLLLALLGELDTRGVQHCALPFGAGYAAQAPFVLSDSVRDNIIAGRPFNAARYATVLAACALDNDIRGWPEGDATRVGERGVTLSGGQKARVALARTLYSEEAAYLLDDPLAAVDATVGAHLWAQAIRGPLSANAAVVLVTHHVSFAARADRIIVLGNGGRVVAVGTWAELSEKARDGGLETGAALGELLLSTEKNEEAPQISSKSAEEEGGGGAKLDSPTLAPDEKVVQKSTLVSSPTSASSSPSPLPSAGRTARLYAKSFGSPIAVVCLVLLLLGGAALAAVAQVVLSRWCSVSLSEQRSSYWIGLFGGLVCASILVSLARAGAFFEGAVAAAGAMHDAALLRVVRAPLAWFDANPSGRVLNRFSKDVGVIDDALPLVTFDFFNVASMILATLGLVLAANPYLLLALAPLTVGFTILRRRYMASARLVKSLEAQARSPVFSLLGEVLEGLPTVRAARLAPALRIRFAEALDMHSRAYFAWLAGARWLGVRLDILCLALLSVFALAAAGTRGSAPPALVGLALSQALGMANAFQWAVRQSSELETLLVSAQRLVEYAEIEPVEDVDMDDNAAKEAAREEAGRRGSIAMRQVSINISESSTRGRTSSSPLLSPTWPTSGTLELLNLRLRYSAKGPWVLDGVTASIPSGTRVGIVGRTGAGKSSLLAALMRLTEPEQRSGGGGGGGGNTTSVMTSGASLDGIDVMQVPLSRLRRAFSYIPQDPLLLAGTVRENLDPFLLWEDARVWAALRDAQLERAVLGVGGLSARVDPGGTNWSVGQRQCLCLARALLRDARVLVLDEASANVDADTDAALQAALRGPRFTGVTVIAIAHRLSTVIDFDQVIVMAGGRVAEAGEPCELLNPFTRRTTQHTAASADGVGALYLLAQDGGAVHAEALMEKAEAAAASRNHDKFL